VQSAAGTPAPTVVLDLNGPAFYFNRNTSTLSIAEALYRGHNGRRDARAGHSARS
jgi:hypothetical protein